MRQTQTYGDVVENFWSRVQKTDTCWLWLGKPNKAGYGVFKWEGVYHYCHRFVLEMQSYDLTNMTVLHDCDTPNYVNPDHLIIGTDVLNVADKCSKGRQSRGETHGMSKLSDEDTRQIKLMLAMGIYQKTIAQQFNIDQSLVSKIKTGVTRSRTKVAA